MIILADDVLEVVFAHLRQGRLPPAVIRVNKQWYRLGVRDLYSDISLKLAVGSTIDSPEPVISCMKTLATSPTAVAVRHLAIQGFVSGGIRDLILSILEKTTGLLSLDIRIQVFPPDPLLSHRLCTSKEFLSRLVAINTSDVSSFILLAAGRSLHAIRIHGFMDALLRDQVLTTLVASSSQLTQLQLAFNIETIGAITELLCRITHSFPTITVLGVQFRLPKPADVTFEVLEHIIHEVGPVLSCLYSLNTLSLAVLPDPMLQPSRETPTIDDNRLQANIDRHEAKTRELAQMVVANYASALRRIELRWHGWTVDTNGWTPIDQCDDVGCSRQGCTEAMRPRGIFDRNGTCTP
ncbi:hypothetical protein A0H81_12826 [Grifola frondosa]|uniref:F-box domain-containing protein n=1 Tax=Grifola frondosa TaxID=5627 RepID=A0A1C7LS68_GRIFR|nr:hypothetical protein A0H81_12826 [Grifola frondosa]